MQHSFACLKMTFRHTAIDFDPSLPWADICVKLFKPDRPYLCVVEKFDTNSHVHMQGQTDMAQRVFDDYCRELCKDHYKYKDPKARPIHHSRRRIDEEGYKYMCKENPVACRHVLAKNMFTDEELTELWEKSELYVKEMKEGLRKHLSSTVPLDDDPAKLHADYRLSGLEYYIDQDKMPPPNFQKHILWAMARAEPPCKRRKIYVSERI